MNKDELLKQKEVLQAELDKLEELIKKEDEPAYYVPKMHEKYFFIDDEGTVKNTTWHGVYFDRIMCDLDNCYKTSSEARYARDIQKDLVKLRRLASKLNEGEKFIWEEEAQNKYYLVYDSRTHEITQCASLFFQDGRILCLSSSFKAEAIELFGKERLKEILTYQRY